MKQFRKLLLGILAVTMLSGCPARPEPQPTPEPTPEVTATPKPTPDATATPAPTPDITDAPVPTEEPGPSVSISEDDIYDTKDEVALYIYTFHHLPSCYMTKKQARKKGWTSGALNRTIKGMCIGGDYFSNFEGYLPDTGEDYYECDIGTMYTKSRGAKRIIYTLSGDVWYTEDHYESFEQLYEGDN